MKLVRTLSDEFIKTLKVSANLFKKYQMTIHGETEEESDDESFFNFLVKSSLQVHFVFTLLLQFNFIILYKNLILYKKNKKQNF